jgi:hypothetical protein
MSGTPNRSFTGTAEDSEPILWSYPAAAMIDAGVQRLIARLDSESGTYPTPREIDKDLYGATTPPEIIDAVAFADRVFRRDVGRFPTPVEVLAGLLDIDTELALFTYIANDILVGDRVMWPLHDDNGKLLHQARDGSEDTLVFAYGTVTAQPEGWNGPNTIASDDGRTAIIGRKWLIKVRDPLGTP